MKQSRRRFVLGLFLLIGMRGNAASICPDDYPPRSFPEAEDELASFLDEYFPEAGLSLPPTPNQLRRHGLRPVSDGWALPDALHRVGKRSYPLHPGLWRVSYPGRGLVVLHILVRDPASLSESEAFNTYNDLLGDLFADYDDPAYGMTLLPEGVRRRWRGRYLGITVRIYGVRDDATGLKRSVGDVILTDYSPWVHRYLDCGGDDETAAAGR